MEFLIDDKTKKRARKRRVQGESRWRILQVIMLAGAVATIAFLVVAVSLTISGEDVLNVLGPIFAFAISLMVALAAGTFLHSRPSRGIGDRFNEKLWIENGKLYHFVQVSFAAGLNTWSTDETGYLFEMDINSIHDAKADPRSGRVEFKVNGVGNHMSDVSTKQVDRRWDLKNCPMFFYDYTDPGLVTVLSKYGVTFSEETIHYNYSKDGI